MLKRNIGMNTICTHTGAIEDVVHGGAVSPIYMSTSYDFIDNQKEKTRRYSEMNQFVFELIKETFNFFVCWLQIF